MKMSKEESNHECDAEETVEETTDEVIEEVTEELDEVSKLTETIATLESELEEEKNKFLKAHADLENTKRRIENDFNQRDKYKIQSFATGILPVVDNIEKVISNSSITDETLKEAMEMIYRQLMTSLENEGITEIEALDQKFDPNVHHAVMLETIDGMEPDIVVEVLQKGYKLKDRVLRASMVKVSQ